MSRTFYLAYGLGSYGLFMACYNYSALFFGNLLLPQTIDGPIRSSPGVAVAINLGLVLLFGLQHSIMARPGFKRVWTKFVPQPIERSTYVLFSTVALAMLVWFWQPIAGTVWNLTQPTARAVLWTLFGLGWLMVPGVSLLINHFDLFGLRQVWLHYQGKPYESLPFRTPLFYARVRHPLYIAWALAFWATPTMTVGHALLAAGLTAYMAIAVVWEERDLIAHFGSRYLEYQRSVPMFVPRLITAKSATSREQSAVETM